MDQLDPLINQIERYWLDDDVDGVRLPLFESCCGHVHVLWLKQSVDQPGWHPQRTGNCQHGCNRGHRWLLTLKTGCWSRAEHSSA